MVRASSSSRTGHSNAEENPEHSQRKRLKSLAYSNNLLSETPAKPLASLCPSNTVVKHRGKDILKKSNRKNRFLFSFPGLLAPITGGKIGGLKDLGTKNPVLYLDFPQGRMKLFGTIVYPKNRYLTLQFKGGKNVICEDCFDNMVVFSDVWWIGTKNENPEEARLDFPKDFCEEKCAESDFKGGAGAASTFQHSVKKNETKQTIAQSTKVEVGDGYTVGEENRNDSVKVTPLRLSERTSGKTFNFAETSSGEDSDDDYASVSEEENKVVEFDSSAEASTGEKMETAMSVDGDNESEDAVENTCSGKNKVTPLSTSKSKILRTSKSAMASSNEHRSSGQSSLVQPTLSAMFKKVEGKKESRKSKKG